MEELLRSFPVVIEIPVAWGDMDAFQHVNNTVYFRWFESARIAYFDTLNYQELMQQSDIGPILASTSCTFKFPVTYPDTVSVGTRVIDVGEHRFIMRYLVVTQRHERKAAEGEGIVVSYHYREQRKAALPELWRQRILELEKRGE